MLIKDVLLSVDNIKIAGQLYLPDRASRATVCICHGIPSGRPPDPADKGYPFLAETICREGFLVFIFNFRGAGVSGGNIDLPGWTRDLKAAIDYLCVLPEAAGAGLVLLGFSAGAAVSVVAAAADKRASSVIACACPAEFSGIIGSEPKAIVDYFCGIGTIRDSDFPLSTEEWFNGFKQISPIRYIAGIAPRPLLLVHGSQDDVVDISHAHKLYERAGEPKRLVVIDGAGHRLRRDDRAVAVVLRWLKSRHQK